MALCVADVEFLYNRSGEAFPKKVIISGVRDKIPITCTIDYKLPTLYAKLDNENQILNGRSEVCEFGKMDLKGKDDKVEAILKQFNIIVTKTKQERSFLRQFSNAKMYKLE